MQKLLSVYKPSGMTPYEVIKRIQLKPQFTKTKISYAGRLDPLAHGVLLLMLGKETKNRDHYLSLPKKYEFEIVLGLQTDTYDILGVLDNFGMKQVENVNLFVNTFVKQYIGKKLQKYPPYSSKAISGKPLFWWAKNNKLTEIIIPTKEIEIYDFSIISIGEIKIDELKQIVFEKINSVTGDFRQKEIKECWNNYFLCTKTKKLVTAKFEITCSSGTYVREIVNQMGNKAGCGAIAIDILRTAVGEYIIKNTEKL